MTTERRLFDSKSVIHRRSRRRMVIAGAAAGSCLAPATIGGLLRLQEVGSLSLPVVIRSYLVLSAVGAVLGAALLNWTFPPPHNERKYRVSRFVGFRLPHSSSAFSSLSPWLRFVMGAPVTGAVFLAGLPLLFGSIPHTEVLIALGALGAIGGLLLGTLFWPSVHHAAFNFTRVGHDLAERISLSALILLATTIAFGLVCADVMDTSYGQLVCSGHVLFGRAEWVLDPQGTCPQAYLVWTRFPLAVAVPTLTAVWLGLLAAHERRTSSRLAQALRRNEHSSLALGPSIPISSPELAEVLPLRASELRASHVLAVHSRLDTASYRTNANPPLAFIASDPSKS